MSNYIGIEILQHCPPKKIMAFQMSGSLIDIFGHLKLLLLCEQPIAPIFLAEYVNSNFEKDGLFAVW